jgi:transporter family-2 protein
MQKSLILAILVALASGLAIGTQASLNSAASRTAGATLTGLLVNFAGGAAAGIVLVILYLKGGAGFLSAARGWSLFAIIVVSGILGLGIITGITYSLPKVGVAAGLAAIIAGQMVVAVIVDTFALAGGEPIPLSWVRIAGLALLALGTWALLSK